MVIRKISKCKIVDKIRQFVQKNCLSDMGRDLVEAMKFSTEPTEIRERLEETQEFMSILEEEDNFPVIISATPVPF